MKSYSWYRLISGKSHVFILFFQDFGFYFQESYFWYKSSTQVSFVFTGASTKKCSSLFYLWRLCGGCDKIYLAPEGVPIYWPDLFPSFFSSYSCSYLLGGGWLEREHHKAGSIQTSPKQDLLSTGPSLLMFLRGEDFDFRPKESFPRSITFIAQRQEQNLFTLYSHYAPTLRQF